LEAVILDDDAATITFKVRRDGAEVERTVDLWCANNRLYEIGQQQRGKPAHEYYSAVVELMESLGFPTVRHATADKFVEAIRERMALLKNADGGGPTQGSPASTEPPPSSSTPPPG
jgi:hypothetical protein